MSRKQRMPLSEFLRRFGTDESCRDYLAVQRWPEGFVCPKCGQRLVRKMGPKGMYTLCSNKDCKFVLRNKNESAE